LKAVVEVLVAMVALRALTAAANQGTLR